MASIDDKADIPEKDKETVKLYKALCMGYKDAKLYVAKHEYYDVKPHMENSHGICLECWKLYDNQVQNLEARANLKNKGEKT